MRIELQCRPGVDGYDRNVRLYGYTLNRESTNCSPEAHGTF